MPGTGKTFEVSLVTPDGAAYEGEAEMLIVPGQIGEIGVLARHAPLIATLKAGSTRIHPGGGADVIEFATGPGLLPGDPRPRDRARRRRGRGVARSTTSRARAQLEAAQAELEAIDRGESSADRWQVEQRIRHAENQLAVAGRGYAALRSAQRQRTRWEAGTAESCRVQAVVDELRESALRSSRS